MKKLMSTLAIVGCTLLASFGMTSEVTACESDYWQEKESGTFYCVYCEEHFDKYCNNCDNYRDVWYAYCEQYSMMNHCEDCDTDYYRYCDCNEKYEGYDYEIFAYEYDEYMRNYCTYECEEHEGVIVRYYEHCCLCEGHDDDCTDDYEEYLEDLNAIRNK